MLSYSPWFNEYKMNNDEICFLPAIKLASEIRNRRLSAVEVVSAFLARITRVNPALNAYVTLCETQALNDAALADKELSEGGQPGPLHGVPFSVKDLVYTAGARTTSGSRIYENFIPKQDALAVSRLRAAGAILLGKTNTPEFGYKATTENLLFGSTRNPWNIQYTSGGSSGGAAAATAAGLSPLSVSTDGGGSIRIPASFCGVFGLKPTFGRVPTLPGSGGWRTLSHTGPTTRTVADAALMLDVMAGPDEIDRYSLPATGPTLSEVAMPRRGLRLGYSADLGFALVDPEIPPIMRKALTVLEKIGHQVEMVDLDLRASKGVFDIIVLAENASAHRAELEEKRDLMDEALAKFIERGSAISAADYIGANRRRDELAARLASFFSQHSLLLTPTVAVPPFPIGAAPKQIAGVSIDPSGWIPFTYPFNLTGNPAANLPCGLSSKGLPVGLQVVGPRHADALVLNLCAQFEAAQPWPSQPEA